MVGRHRFIPFSDGFDVETEKPKSKDLDYQLGSEKRRGKLSNKRFVSER